MPLAHKFTVESPHTVYDEQYIVSQYTCVPRARHQRRQWIGWRNTSCSYDPPHDAGRRAVCSTALARFPVAMAAPRELFRPQAGFPGREAR
jgi:hypothetical protein